MSRTCRIYKTPGTGLPAPDTSLETVENHRNAQGLPIQIEVSEVTISPGQTVVVVGPNGVGKSALLGELARAIGQNDIVETFFGSRHLTFQDEEVDQVGQSIKHLQMQLNSQLARHRNPLGEQHLKSVVRRVLNQAGQINEDIIDEALETGDLLKAVSSRNRTFATINNVFAAARMPITLFLENGLMRVRRGSSTYGIDKLSDGERAALLIVGAVLIRPKDSYIVIDEPERHLNPGISGPLLGAMMAARPDLGYVFSTHDLKLLDWLRPNQLLHLRNSDVIEDQPEKRRYDFSLIDHAEELPEALRFAVLGARDKLLLVEGGATSQDKALYGLLYEGWDVLAKGGNDTVNGNIAALRSNQAYHWLKVAGLIDGDGRNRGEIETLGAKSIFVLPVPTVECLFLLPDVLAALAEAEHAHRGKLSAAERLDFAQSVLRTELPKAKSAIVARRLVWHANRAYASAKLTYDAVANGATEIPALDLAPLRIGLEAELDAAIGNGVDLKILKMIAVKGTGIPDKVAKAIGFYNFIDLQNSVLQHIRTRTAYGEAMRTALTDVLPTLPD